MSRRAYLGAGLAVGLVMAVLAISSEPAASDVVPASLGTKMVGFYLAEETLQHDKPVNTTSKQRAATGPSAAAMPTRQTTLDWGVYEPPHTFSFMTDGVFTAFIAGRDVAHFEEIQVTFTRGEDTWSGRSRITANTSRMLLIDDTIKVPIGVSLAGAQWHVHDEIEVELRFTGAALADSPLDARIVYDSREHPSGLVVGVADAGPVAVSGEAQPVFLDDGRLNLTPPLNDTDRIRGVEEGALTHVAGSVEWEWGLINVTADSDTQLFTDTPVTVWLGCDCLVSASRDLQITMKVSGREPSQERTNVQPIVWDPLLSSVQKIVIGLPTEDMRIPAGSDVRLNFTLWGSGHDAIGHFFFIYGSTGHPAGFTLGVPPGSFGIGPEPDDSIQAQGGSNFTGPGGAGGPGAGGSGTGSGQGGAGGAGNGTGTGAGGQNETGTRAGGNGSADDADDGEAKDVSGPRNSVPSTGLVVLLAAAVGALALMRRRS